MARGKDTRNHPNRKVGRRDVPRLAQALGGMLESSRQYHVEEYNDPEDFQMQHSMARFLPEDAYEKGISENDAAEALRQYRNERDMGYDMQGEKEDIRDAYRARNDY